MICCTLIAALAALLIRPFTRWRSDPMAWRLDTSAGQPQRATSRLQSFVHAGRGIAFTARHEPNMRLHLGAGTVVIALGLWTGLSLDEWRWIGLAVALVLVAETINTAIEQACNAVTIDHRPAIGAAKDAAAGAVLMAAGAAALIGASIFVPHVIVGNDAWPTYICGGTD